MKRCTKCGEVKPVENFSRLNSACKECCRKRGKEWYRLASNGPKDTPPLEKICVRCSLTKPIEEFEKRRDSRTGYGGRCKACFAVIARRSYDRHRDGRIEYAKRYKTINPPPSHPRNNITRAREAVNKAIIRKKIVKPESCSRCSRTDRMIQAHHEDYSKPLDIVWLCAPCHAQERWRYK